MEESTKKKMKKTTIVFFIISICLFTIGIILLSIGFSIEKLSMLEDNWFESTTKRYRLIYGGVFCLVPALFFMIVAFSTKNMKAKPKVNIFSSPSEFLEQQEEYVDHLVKKEMEIQKRIADANKVIPPVCPGCGAPTAGVTDHCKFCGRKFK